LAAADFAETLVPVLSIFEPKVTSGCLAGLLAELPAPVAGPPSKITATRRRGETPRGDEL